MGIAKSPKKSSAEDAKDTEGCTRVNQGRKTRRGRRNENCGRRAPEKDGEEPKRRGQLKGAKKGMSHGRRRRMQEVKPEACWSEHLRKAARS